MRLALLWQEPLQGGKNLDVERGPQGVPASKQSTLMSGR